MQIRSKEELDKLNANYIDEPKDSKNWLKTFIYDESVFSDDCLHNAFVEFSLANHEGAEKFGREILRRIIARSKK